jgi:hypothetical protein
VHQGDAHSWVEVWDPRVGWTTWDPTPAGGLMLNDRTGLFAETDAFIEAMRMRWRHYVVGYDLATLDEALDARGLPRPSNRSPLAFAKELVARGDPMGALALRVATRHAAARFGDEPLSPNEFDTLRRALHEARAAAQRSATAPRESAAP